VAPTILATFLADCKFFGFHFSHLAETGLPIIIFTFQSAASRAEKGTLHSVTVNFDQ